MRIRISGLLLALAMLVGASALSAAAQQGGPPPGGRPAGGPPPMGPQLQLSSTAFADGTPVPDKYTCAAGFANMTSPAVSWVNAPKDTASFALLVHDPEAHPMKSINDVTHWIIFNIPGESTGLPEGVKADAPATVGTQGKNIAGQPSYFGPCAPPGPNHHYTWELFALDSKLDLPAGATRSDVMKAMDGHILAGTVYIGLFHRQAGGMMPPPPPTPPPTR